ncbi:MAG TPA: hypothetical protein VGI81_11495 [Tepidisphaeraceae bacterium]|jgi:hypothetical protein
MPLASLVFDSATLWPVALAAGAGLTLGVVWLYPAQGRGAGLARWAPPVLRWMAVAAIAVSLLKPVILEPRSADEQGAVVVLVDCSKSMSVTDPGRTPAERVALAGALGRLSAGARSDVAASLGTGTDRVDFRSREVLRAQSDLDYARVSGHGIADRQQRLVDAVARYTEAAHTLAARAAMVPQNSELDRRLRELEPVPAPEARDAWSQDVRERIERVQSAARAFQSAADEQLYESNPVVRATCDALAKASRLELAKDALLDPAGGLLAKLGGRDPVLGFSIAKGDLSPVTLTTNGRPVAALALSADANESDLAGAVTAAVNGIDKRPVRAVVLLSDGRQVGGRGDVASAVRPSSSVPVFTVGLAAERTPDLSVTHVSLPAASAFAGEVLEGEVGVSDDGDLKPPTEIQIITSSSTQAERLAPRTRRDRREHGRQWSARFAVPINPKDGAAAERIAFAVPPAPGEATTVNNRVERWVKVVSSKLRVAVCTAAPTWDFQYLRGALARRPWVRLESQVLDPVRPHLALTPAQIFDQDVLILSDVPVGALDVNQWDAVRTLLMDRGGSVILIAGTTYPLADYAQQPIARTLLPFHDVRPAWKEWPGEQPAFHFVPTPLGEREALRLGAGPDARRWQELPGVYRFLQIPDRNMYTDVRPLLVEAEGGSAVLTERRLGAGHVFFLGLDETWRWRLKDGERETDQFWRQLVRHAGGEPYAATRGPLALDVDRVAAAPGEPVHVRARPVQLQAARKGPRPAPQIEIVRDGKVIATRALESAGAGQFTATISDLPAGDYQFQLRGPAPGDVVRLPVHIADSDEAEMRDVSGDRDRLARIARSSGGQYLPIDQVDRLPERLRALHEAEPQFVRYPLWNSPLFFGFVLACFAGEWALRKRFGLV